MTILTRVSCGLALGTGLLGTMPAVQADTAPMVAGKYASMGWHMCQTQVHTPTATFSKPGGGTGSALTVT